MLINSNWSKLSSSFWQSTELIKQWFNEGQINKTPDEEVKNPTIILSISANDYLRFFSDIQSTTDYHKDGQY